VDVWYRQKVRERLIKTKAVQLQSQLKQAAMAMIRQMDVRFTAMVDEVVAARHAMMTNITSTRRTMEEVRTTADVDGVNIDVLLDSVSSSLASILLISAEKCYC